MRYFVTATFVLFASSAAAPAEAEEGGAPPTSSQVYHVRGQAVEGWVVGQDEAGVTFRDALTGDRLHLPWDAFSRSDRERIRDADKALGAKVHEEDAEGAPEPVGELVQATRFQLKTGKEIVGREIPQLSTDKQVRIRTREAREFSIPRELIKRTEPVMVPEGEIYSKEEMYERLLAEINPQDARDHINLAEKLVKLGYWTKALEHYESAVLLDERFKEMAEPKKEELVVRIIEERCAELDRLIETAVTGRRFAQAKKYIGLLEKLDQDSPYLTKWLMQLPVITEKMQEELRRAVVMAYYREMDELIRKWVWGRVADGEQIPIKVVTLKNGERYMGMLEDENEEMIVLKDRETGTVTKIEKTLVADVHSVELRQNLRQATFEESKQYVQDTTGGITADILKSLEERFKEFPLTQEEIQEYWNGRLKKVREITSEGKKMTTAIYTLNEVSFGKGSWLRGGGEVVSIEDPNASSGRQQAQPRRPDPEQETDPEKWWLHQPLELRYQVLKGFAAEALMDVVKERKPRCPSCGGAGVLKALTGGGVEGSACPYCRGAGCVVRIRYR